MNVFSPITCPPFVAAIADPPAPSSGSSVALLIFFFVIFLLFLTPTMVRHKDRSFVNSAKLQGRQVCEIRFIPSFLHSQKYAGIGFLELKKDGLVIFGRRKFSKRKKIKWFLIVTLLLLLAFNLVLGLMGVWMLSSFLFRSRHEDHYTFTPLDDPGILGRVVRISQKTPLRYILEFIPSDYKEETYVVFQSKEFNGPFNEILKRLNPEYEIESTYVGNFEIPEQSNQIAALTDIEKRVARGNIRL
jgi:hypothetical protein